MSDDRPILGEYRVIHKVVVVPAKEMDAPELFIALCTCGEYRSAPATFIEARKSGQQHADAKNRPQEPK